MSSKIPPCLQQLLDATDDTTRDRAWAGLLSEYSRLLLHVARSTAGGHDDVMDRYLFVLDALRREDFRRLRAFSSDGRGSFTTWLVAVTRRLCIDEHRHRYGRSPGEEISQRLRERAQLVDLLNSVETLESIESTMDGPDRELQTLELGTALDRALAGLPMTDRLLVRMRFEDGLAVPEIARILGEASPFRIYRQLDRILSQLRKSLEEAGIEGSIP
jgi:RNA polymerase sigma factor (sigma-70 family)